MACRRSFRRPFPAWRPLGSLRKSRQSTAPSTARVTGTWAPHSGSDEGACQWDKGLGLGRETGRHCTVLNSLVLFAFVRVLYRHCYCAVLVPYVYS
ncbi:hypothetical protein J3E69DRAFT_347936 [Trichoderma sp. SZMC 28015]